MYVYVIITKSLSFYLLFIRVVTDQLQTTAQHLFGPGGGGCASSQVLGKDVRVKKWELSAIPKSY